jgi:hypothetical protein
MDNFVSNPNHKGRRAFCALLCMLAIATAPSIGFAGEGMGTAKEGGLGTAAALTSLIYGPVKIIYASGGMVIAGFAWVFSGGDSEVASTVLTRAVRGTYVVTPATLTGKEEIEFVGRSPEYRESSGRTQVAAAPDGW